MTMHPDFHGQDGCIHRHGSRRKKDDDRVFVYDPMDDPEDLTDDHHDQHGITDVPSRLGADDLDDLRDHGRTRQDATHVS